MSQGKQDDLQKVTVNEMDSPLEPPEKGCSPVKTLILTVR